MFRRPPDPAANKPSSPTFPPHPHATLPVLDPRPVQPRSAYDPCRTRRVGGARLRPGGGDHSAPGPPLAVAAGAGTVHPAQLQGPDPSGHVLFWRARRQSPDLLHWKGVGPEIRSADLARGPGKSSDGAGARNLGVRQHPFGCRPLPARGRRLLHLLLRHHRHGPGSHRPGHLPGGCRRLLFDQTRCHPASRSRPGARPRGGRSLLRDHGVAGRRLARVECGRPALGLDAVLLVPRQGRHPAGYPHCHVGGRQVLDTAVQRKGPARHGSDLRINPRRLLRVASDPEDRRHLCALDRGRHLQGPAVAAGHRREQTPATGLETDRRRHPPADQMGRNLPR